MSANFNYVVISPDGRKNRQGVEGQVLKCKDSFVCVCPEKDISSLVEKRGWRDNLIIMLFVFVLKRTSPHLRRKEGGETI